MNLMKALFHKSLTLQIRIAQVVESFTGEFEPYQKMIYTHKKMKLINKKRLYILQKLIFVMVFEEILP